MMNYGKALVLTLAIQVFIRAEIKSAKYDNRVAKFEKDVDLAFNELAEVLKNFVKEEDLQT